MDPFSFVVTLLSFVFALALTQVLSSIGGLFSMRTKVKFSGLLALAMTNAMLLVFSDWLSLWPLGLMKNWPLLSVVVQFLVAISVYLICVIVSPNPDVAADLNMEDVYWRQRRYFYVLWIGTAALAMIANTDLTKAGQRQLLDPENAVAFSCIPVAAIAMLFSARWIQWAVGLISFAILVYFTIKFSPAIAPSHQIP